MMLNLLQHLSQLAGEKLTRAIAFWSAVAVLLGLLASAYDSLAFDREVRALVQTAQAELEDDQKRTLSQLLASMKALEERVRSGEILLRIEVVAMQIDRLREHLAQSAPAQVRYWEGRIREKQRELDRLMDRMPVLEDSGFIHDTK